MIYLIIFKQIKKRRSKWRPEHKDQWSNIGNRWAKIRDEGTGNQNGCNSVGICKIGLVKTLQLLEAVNKENLMLAIFFFFIKWGIIMWLKIKYILIYCTTCTNSFWFFYTFFTRIKKNSFWSRRNRVWSSCRLCRWI